LLRRLLETPYLLAFGQLDAHKANLAQ
jgi:hypothetical protein